MIVVTKMKIIVIFLLCLIHSIQCQSFDLLLTGDVLALTSETTPLYTSLSCPYTPSEHLSGNATLVYLGSSINQCGKKWILVRKNPRSPPSQFFVELSDVTCTAFVCSSLALVKEVSTTVIYNQSVIYVEKNCSLDHGQYPSVHDPLEESSEHTSQSIVYTIIAMLSILLAVALTGCAIASVVSVVMYRRWQKVNRSSTHDLVSDEFLIEHTAELEDISNQDS